MRKGKHFYDWGGEERFPGGKGEVVTFWDLGGHFPEEEIGALAVGGGGVGILCLLRVPHFIN